MHYIIIFEEEVSRGSHYLKTAGGMIYRKQEKENQIMASTKVQGECCSFKNGKDSFLSANSNIQYSKNLDQNIPAAEQQTDEIQISQDKRSAVVIPSYNPNSSICDFLSQLRLLCSNMFIIVDDGSRNELKPIFAQIKKIPDCIVLTHAVNLGKGRALKTAFNYYLNVCPDGIGVVTADGDGQHHPEDIVKCLDALEKDKESFILGVRDFSSKNVPWKSSIGNKLTNSVMRLVLHYPITDTQTGLRGIPSSLLELLLNTFGERFEFETEMLIVAREKKFPFHQVPIRTIYMDQNNGTHFKPVIDSFKIYIVILKHAFRLFFLFLLSGAFSAILDLFLFYCLFHFILSSAKNGRLFFSVLIARLCSLVVNYLLNRNIVFKHRRKYVFDLPSAIQYSALCLFVFAGSYYLTKWGNYLFADVEISLLKACADLFLFFVSFIVQKKLIFH